MRPEVVDFNGVNARERNGRRGLSWELKSPFDFGLLDKFKAYVIYKGREE